MSSRNKYQQALAIWQWCEEDALQFAMEASKLTKNQREQKNFKNREKEISQKVRAAQFELPHKLFLPNGTSAALVSPCLTETLLDNLNSVIITVQ